MLSPNPSIIFEHISYNTIHFLYFSNRRYNIDRISENELVTLKFFTEKWTAYYKDIQKRIRRSLYYQHNPTASANSFADDVKLTWIIHCGGSQGFEAATILQELNKMVDVRTVIRGYQQCEHTDTLSGTVVE